MPSAYAHHRFGAQLLPLMPADVRGPVLRHRALFDIGLHGPDFLFFHHFIRQTPLYRMGSACHEKSGRIFFTDACAHLRQQPGEPAFAYLVGLLAHYSLDRACHPFVYAVTNDEDAAHAETETEFDRYLMALDGIKKPHETNILRHLKLRKEDLAVVAGFYQGLSGADAAQCIRNMALARRLLTLPGAHGVIVKFTQLAGGNTAGQVMTLGPNPKCSHHNGKLLELYENALSKFPELLQQLSRHLACGEAFGDDFAANFNKG